MAEFEGTLDPSSDLVPTELRESIELLEAQKLRDQGLTAWALEYRRLFLEGQKSEIQHQIGAISRRQRIAEIETRRNLDSLEDWLFSNWSSLTEAQKLHMALSVYGDEVVTNLEIAPGQRAAIITDDDSFTVGRLEPGFTISLSHWSDRRKSPSGSMLQPVTSFSFKTADSNGEVANISVGSEDISEIITNPEALANALHNLMTELDNLNPYSTASDKRYHAEQVYKALTLLSAATELHPTFAEEHSDLVQWLDLVITEIFVYSDETEPEEPDAEPKPLEDYLNEFTSEELIRRLQLLFKRFRVAKPELYTFAHELQCERLYIATQDSDDSPAIEAKYWATLHLGSEQESPDNVVEQRNVYSVLDEMYQKGSEIVVD